MQRSFLSQITAVYFVFLLRWLKYAQLNAQTLSFLSPPAAARPAARSPVRRVTVTPDGSSGLRIPAAPSQEEDERFPAAGYPGPASLRPPRSEARPASCIAPVWAARASVRRAAVCRSCSVCQNNTQTPTSQGKRENPCVRLGFWRSTHRAELPWRWRTWDLAEDFQGSL